VNLQTSKQQLQMRGSTKDLKSPRNIYDGFYTEQWVAISTLKVDK